MALTKVTIPKLLAMTTEDSFKSCSTKFPFIAHQCVKARN